MLAATLLVAACARRPGANLPSPYRPGADPRVPPFAAVPYQPFARQAVVGIALREWRLFGSPVDDLPGEGRPPVRAEDKPERWAGLWQRVGEYWWIGMNPDAPESGWTGMHDGSGTVFPAGADGDYAWSGAFISYVMRIAGAGSGFPYSATHADYIDAARTGTPLLQAEPPGAYAPVPGDLICMGRGRAGDMQFADLPAPRFPAHCDIVVDVGPNEISVIGGNVDDAVTLKHVPVTADGKLADQNGLVLDTRWPWFVVLRVIYDP